MTLREMIYNDIKGYKPKIPKKKKVKINKEGYVSGDKGVDWGQEDSINFDQRDRE
jgi:hypothetical protein